MSRRTLNFAGAVMALAAAFSLAACGGGGGGSSAPVGSGVPVNPPTPPTNAQSTIAVPASGGSVSLPSFGGYASTATFPSSNATGSANVNVTVATTLPTGLPGLQSRGRIVKSIASNVYLYFTFVSPVALTFNGYPGFTVTMPSSVNTAGQQFFIAVYSNGAWVEPAAGPATVSGQQVTFAAVNATPGLTIPANIPLYVALYSAPQPPATSSAAYLTQFSASKVTGTAQAGAANTIVAEISAAGDPQAHSLTFNADTLTLGTGTSAQSSVRVPQSVLVPNSRPFTAPREMAVGDTHVPDEALLVQRLRSQMRRAAGATRSIRASSIPSTLVPGTSTANIWVQNGSIGSSGGSFQKVAATLEAQTTHGNIWIDSSLLTNPSITSSAFTTIANDFENAYASDTLHFGSPDYTATMGALANGGNSGSVCDSTGASLGTGPVVIVPADHRINVFVLDIQALGTGVGGYFYSADYFTQAALNCLIGSNGYTAANVPQSNEAPIVYVGYNTASSSNFELNEDLVRGTAHEFQHLINFVNHVIVHPVASQQQSESTFINEGLSVLAQDLAVHSLFQNVPFDVDDAVGTRALTYLDAPSNFSLTGFSGIDPTAFHEGTGAKYNCGGGCYGSAYLFQRYLYDRCGNDAYTHAMETGGLVGGANIVSACASSAQGEAFGDVVGDFAIALAAGSAGITNPGAKFSFGTLGLTSTYTDQFGHAITLPGIFVSPVGANAALTSSVPVGGLNFLSLTSLPASGEALTVTDNQSVTGFALKGGLIQH